MKKWFILACMCFLVTPTIAQTCNGGTPVKSNTTATNPDCSADTCNGHEFCKSNNGMNWWSAFAWCESQGRKLASTATMCPHTSPAANDNAGDCPNLQGVGDDQYVWSTLVYSDTHVATVNLSTGSLHSGKRTYDFFAFCE